MKRRASQYVVIGAGAGGMSCASTIRRLDPDGFITVISDEPYLPYYRPMIPFVISGERKEDEIILDQSGTYNFYGIDIRINIEVTGINTEAHEIYLSNGEPLKYDRLLIATGSRSIIPSDIEGIDTERVFAIRTMEDVKAISDIVDSIKEAVVVGGGLVGVKTALALSERGIGVKVVERESEVLPMIMEPDAGSYIHSAMDKIDIEIITGNQVKAIKSKDGVVASVLLQSGEELPCQIVCFGVGVRPSLEIVKDTPVKVEKGILADKYTRTNVEDVYTAGDVAETINPITGNSEISPLWSSAVQMGRVAGYNMTGKAVEYPGSFRVLNATQVGGLPFISMGIVHTSGTQYESHVFKGSNVYRKLVFDSSGDRLIGALFIGDIERAGIYWYLIRERVNIREIKSLIISHKLHYGHILRIK